MTLIKSNSFLPSPPRLLENFIAKDILDWRLQSNSAARNSSPLINIAESNDGFTVEMSVPGINKKDIYIELDNEILTVSFQKEVNGEINEGANYIRREFNHNSFRRSFHLPKSVVDESKIKAKYTDGILRVILPKKEEAKALPARQITVN